jgi:hypothetical protein
MPSPETARFLPRLTLPLRVSPKYRPLYQYLNDRFADTVVLTIAEIEDLMGSPLPDGARTVKEWWADTDTGRPQTEQARCWREAGRSSQPNLAARTVVFERRRAPVDSEQGAGEHGEGTVRGRP